MNKVINKFLLCINERRWPSLLEHFIDFIKNKIGCLNYKFVVVETSSLCNVRCVWCWMYFSNKKDMGLMEFENFKKFIDLNAEFLKKKKISIVPYHRGEPLIHPKFFDMLDYANEKQVKIAAINTNFSLKVDIDRLVNSPLTGILINIGGTTDEINAKVIKGSDLKLVKNNIRELIFKNKNKIPISIKMNPTKDNLHQLKELPEFFKDLGGDPKNAIIGTTSFPLPAEASKEEINAFFDNVITEDINPFLRFTYDENRNITAKDNRCSFMVPTIKWDGKVSICCHDQLSRIDLGNAFETPIENILRSKKYKSTEKAGKEKQLKFCKNCN